MILTAQEIKDYILNNDCSEQILDELGCGNIRNHGEYITASNPDGNNKQAINLYLNDGLTCVNHTRTMTKNKRATDLFDLIAFCKDCSFPEALRWVCEALGLDYYSEPEELPQSLQILQLLKEMATGESSDEIEQLKPIPEKILSYYLPYGNIMFENDGIDLEVQQEFEVGYCAQTNYITIPLRDSLGTLVGVKGRFFGEPDEYHPKYFFPEKAAKSKMLYGYWQNKDYIKNSKYLFICEAEKGVLQMASMGTRNVVATGSKTISKTQVELITRTGCIPVFAYDKDVEEEELKDIADMFMPGVQVYAIIDKDNILDEKESPSDNPAKWAQLVKNNIYQIR